MNPVKLPRSFNYVGAFLSFRCPYRCSYCITRMPDNPRMPSTETPGESWIRFFDRLENRDVPISLQGGEPGKHPDFIEIVRETSKRHFVDILTSLEFDLMEFVNEIDPEFINRDAPYAPIRVSYHPEQFTLEHILQRVLYLKNAGFKVGLYGVLHPAQIQKMRRAESICADLGIDFRTKPFLGVYRGKLYGEYAYPDACGSKEQRHCECAPSELLIAPNGSIYPCHHHLYGRFEATGHIDDANLHLSGDFRPCSRFGNCNPCDVKIKNNRFQRFGHVSVSIRAIQKARMVA